MQLGRGQRTDLPDETPSGYKKVLYLDKPDLENIYFFFDTFCLQPLSQREADALSMINVIFTSTLDSRVLGEARERGLAYHISSGMARLKDSGSWYFGAELSPQNALPVFDILVAEISRLLNGQLDDADFDGAKQYSMGRYQRSAQTVRGLADGYSGRYFFDGVVEDFYDVPSRIEAVTKDDIFSVAAKMVRDNTWGLTVMGTAKDKLARELNHKLATIWQ